MALPNILNKLQILARNNSTAILTGVGVAGTVSTAILSARASFQAAKKFADLEAILALSNLNEHGDPNVEVVRLTAKERLSAAWVYYVPPIGVGAVTVTSIILANRVASREAATIMAAYALTEKTFTDYRDKVIEKLGSSKEAEIRDSVVEDHIRRNPVVSREVIIAGSGDVLCYDVLSGRYFESSKNEIERAENMVNGQIMDHMAASLSEFYDAVGLPPTGMSDTLGFNANRRCRVRFSTQMSTDGRPCLAVDFLEEPVLGFSKLWG